VTVRLEIFVVVSIGVKVDVLVLSCVLGVAGVVKVWRRVLVGDEVVERRYAIVGSGVLLLEDLTKLWPIVSSWLTALMSEDTASQ
jgi:hypothetical protein